MMRKRLRRRACDDLSEIDVDSFILNRCKPKCPSGQSRKGPAYAVCNPKRARPRLPTGLATRRLPVLKQSRLRIKGWILRHDDQVVDGIQPKADTRNRLLFAGLTGNRTAFSVYPLTDLYGRIKLAKASETLNVDSR